jgi:tetratricopeptide (TPR) repeat protein
MHSKLYLKAKKNAEKAILLLSNAPYPMDDKSTLPAKTAFLKSVEEFTKVIEAEPLNSDAFLYRAELLWLLDDNNCFEDMDMVVKLNPENSSILINIGDKYSFIEDYSKAIEFYTKAIILSGSCYQIGLCCLSLGDAYKKIGKYEEAIDSYTDTIEFVDPALLPIDLYYNRGYCFKKLGMLKGAELDYNEFLKYKDEYLYKDFVNYLES